MWREKHPLAQRCLALGRNGFRVFRITRVPASPSATPSLTCAASAEHPVNPRCQSQRVFYASRSHTSPPSNLLSHHPAHLNKSVLVPRHRIAIASLAGPSAIFRPFSGRGPACIGLREGLRRILSPFFSIQASILIVPLRMSGMIFTVLVCLLIAFSFVMLWYLISSEAAMCCADNSVMSCVVTRAGRPAYQTSFCIRYRQFRCNSHSHSRE